VRAVWNFTRFQPGWGWDAGAHREYSPALDGIYVVNEKGEIVFRRVAPPSDEEVARIVKNVCHHVGRLLERRGLGPQAAPEEIDTLCGTAGRCSPSFMALRSPGA